ncbi:MAG: hypothetical protein WEB53_08635 [Akkermansiaceae bacterium]
MKPKNSKLRRLLPWVALAACLLALLLAIRSGRELVATKEPDEATAADRTRVSLVTSEISATTSLSRDRMASAPLPADLAATYDSEDFAHVPDWIPRPQHAIAADAEDATLRSDGFLEGTVRLTMAGTAKEADDWIRKSLAGTGLQSAPGSSSFESPSPPRRCDVNLETQSTGRTLITLRYEAPGHGNGCACPTCGHGE